jgi:poly(beta-D-mannuronate) lyase
MKFRAGFFAVLIIAACFGAKEVPAQGTCPLYTPVIEITGVRWYEDKKSSIVNPEKAAENQRLQRNIRAFTDGLSDRLDQLLESKSDASVIKCIEHNLVAWAKAGALLTTPTWSVQVAEQTKAIVALQFIFLKLEAIGTRAPDAVRMWRRQSLLTLLKAYKNSQYRNNLYVWSGVAAAAGDLLERDDYLRRYHEAVWRFAINSISEDGTVAFEMNRGKRALVYHAFFYSAMSALLDLRNALGITTETDDVAAVRRLSKVVGDAACEPSLFAHRAGAAQEPLDRLNRAMTAAFGARFNSPAWFHCVRSPDRFAGLGWGGRFDLTVKSMEVVGGSAKRSKQIRD